MYLFDWKVQTNVFTVLNFLLNGSNVRLAVMSLAKWMEGLKSIFSMKTINMYNIFVFADFSV